ncbi:MAG: hypothetical protein OEN01_01200 [Candidatus Krumholzibacteria bacterium]|nr:hypothetical protein [Candidatus Krumholzibacteria bacterium]
MRRCLVAMLLFWLAVAVESRAQSPSGPHDKGRKCDVCHSVHNSALVKLLRAGGGGEDDFEIATSAVGGSSLGCLSCHTTPGLRGRLPMYTGQPAPVIIDGKYLGLDFSDDHPLARAGGDNSRRMGDRRAISGTRSLAEQAAVGPTPAGFDNTPLPGCTACHDVHSGDLLASGAEKERAMCGACHTPGVYSLREHSALACSSCHDLHGGSGRALLADRSDDLVCLSCHSTASTPPNRSRGVAVPPVNPSAHDGKPIEAVGRCLECHPAHHTSN